MIENIIKKGSKKIVYLAKIKTDLEKWEDLAKEYIGYMRGNKGVVDYLRFQVLTPEIMNVLGNVNQKNIIDAGCGEGYLSRALAREGANVVGIDGSKTMINEAVTNNGGENLKAKYLHSELGDSIPLDQEHFDIIIANMVFFSIKDVETVVRNLAECLKKNGEFVVSILHPCFHLNYEQWDRMHELNSNGGLLKISLTESYKDERVIEKSYIDSINKIRVYLRPIEFYTQLFFKLGFVITDFREPILRLNETKEGDKYYHAYLLPRFLILKFKKK